MGLFKVPEVFVEGRKVHTRNIIHSWRMENEKGSYNTSFRKFLFVMVLPDTTKMCVRGSLFWGCSGSLFCYYTAVTCLIVEDMRLDINQRTCML